MAEPHWHAMGHLTMVVNKMCQAGNELPPMGDGFSERQAPLDVTARAVQRCPGTALPVHDAACMVAQHVIPRLVASHAAAIVPASEPAVARFVDLLLGPNADAALGLVTEQRRLGASCEAICHDVLAPAARRVRALWRNDDCDHATFQLGQWRLCRLLYATDHTEICRRAAHRDPAAALVMILSGGEPTFEHALVTQYFARSGWAVYSLPDGGAPANILQANRFHIAWISLDETARHRDVVACIRLVRRASQNPGMGILCGGMELDPMPASWELGADAVAADARTALAVAERWRMWQSDAESLGVQIA